MTNQPKTILNEVRSPLSQFRDLTSKLFNLTGTYFDENTIKDWFALLGKVDLIVLGDVYSKIFDTNIKLNAKTVSRMIEDHYKSEGNVYFNLLIDKLRKQEQLSTIGNECLKIFESLLAHGETIETKINDLTTWEEPSEFRRRFSKSYAKRKSSVNFGNVFLPTSNNRQIIGESNDKKQLG